MIDLEEVLHGSPTAEQVHEFFLKGEFHEEHYLVQAIRRHLLTSEQGRWMYENKVTVEDMLNGRIEDAQANTEAHAIFEAWNAVLGFQNFGF